MNEVNRYRIYNHVKNGHECWAHWLHESGLLLVEPLKKYAILFLNKFWVHNFTVNIGLSTFLYFQI
jgi:hypothetical protein